MENICKLSDVNPILINLTGVRLIVLFSFLLEAPRSAEEIYQHLQDYDYPKDGISIDTVRYDMNSLRQAGCVISRADKSNGFKYKLVSHPFELNIDMDLAKSLSKLYLKGIESYSIKHLLYLDELFIKLAKYTKDEDVAEYLLGISLIKNIDKDLLKDLYNAYLKEQAITFTYNAPNSGKQNIKFVIEYFEFRSKKLYVNGYSLTHKDKAFFLVSRIVAPITVHLQKEAIKNLTQTVQYELTNSAVSNYCQIEKEKIVEQDKKHLIVELTSDNEFKIIQRLLAYGANCKIISPNSFKEKMIETLKSMEQAY